MSTHVCGGEQSQVFVLRVEEDAVTFRRELLTVLYVTVTVLYDLLTVLHVAVTVLYDRMTVLYMASTVLYELLTVLCADLTVLYVGGEQSQVFVAGVDEDEAAFRRELMLNPQGLRSHMQTRIIYKLGFNQNYYTFTLILLIKIVMCSKFP